MKQLSTASRPNTLSFEITPKMSCLGVEPLVGVGRLGLGELGKESPGGRQHSVLTDVSGVRLTVVQGKGDTSVDDHRRPNSVCSCRDTSSLSYTDAVRWQHF